MKRALVAATLAIGLAVCLTGPVEADVVELDVAPPAVSEAPELRATITLPAQMAGERVPATAFSVVEDGEVRQVNATKLAGDQLRVILVVDTSGSMANRPLRAAQEAALGFIEEAPADTPIALVGFGGEPYVASRFTTDRVVLEQAVRSLETRPGTALYDAIALAAGMISPGTLGQSSVVVLADGDDTSSKLELEAVDRRLAARSVRLDAVGFTTTHADSDALRQLATAGGGHFASADNGAALSRIFDELGASLADRYTVSWRSEGSGPTTVRFGVDFGGLVAARELTVALPRDGAPSGRPVAGSPWALALGAACLFLALFLGGRALVGGRSSTSYAFAGGRAISTAPTSFSRATEGSASFAERGLERWGKRRSLNRALDRAGIALRPGEFLVLVGAIGLGVVLLACLLGGPILGLLAAVATFLGCRIYLTVRADRRRARFSDQLSDSLQLLAGSLRAGYGLLQAIDAVAQEADEPTRQEFRRLVIETRLGRDLTEALHSMADRVGGDDFMWIVQAIEIHREVGGDLAQVLDTVGGTIRERNQLHRQVRALSAEGRLSGYILTAVPGLLVLALRVLNPGYLSELGHGTGLLLAIIGSVSLVAGGIRLHRMCRLETDHDPWEPDVNLNLLLGAAAVSSAAMLLWWALSGSRTTVRSSARRGLVAGLGGSGPITDLRAATLATSATDRAVAPAWRSVAERARRLTPAGMVDKLERRILLAGASRWPLDRLLVVKTLLGALIGVVLALNFVVDPSFFGLVLTTAGATAGYLLPDLLLSNAATNCQKRIRLELPDTLDQMTIGVEAGLGFEAAMARAGRSGDGPLAEELVRTLQEIQAGMSRADAMRGLAERNDVAELRQFVLAVRQAETYGIPIAQVLRVQAAELRIKRRQRAEEQAMKLPVKVVFPLVLCILPAIFVVVLGPAAIRVADNIVR